MKIAFRLFVLFFAFLLLISGCTPKNGAPSITIADQLASVGKTLSLDLKQLSADESISTVTFELISGVGSIVGSTYTFTPSLSDVGEEDVTIKVTDGAALSGQCTFTIDIKLSIAGKLTFAGNPVGEYNSNTPVLRVQQNNVNISGYEFNYTPTTGEYEIRGVPYASTKMWFDFEPGEPHAVSTSETRLPGGLAYVCMADLTTTTPSDYDDFDYGNANATYMMHLTTPYDNAVISYTQGDPYPVFNQVTTFTWDAVPGAASCLLQITNDYGFNLGANTGTTTHYTNSSNPMTPLANQDDYYEITIVARDASSTPIGTVNTVYSNGYIPTIRIRTEE